MSTTIALGTKHGKLAQIAPAFERIPEWELTLAEIDLKSREGSRDRSLDEVNNELQRQRFS